MIATPDATPDAVSFTDLLLGCEIMLTLEAELSGELAALRLALGIRDSRIKFLFKYHTECLEACILQLSTTNMAQWH